MIARISSLPPLLRAAAGMALLVLGMALLVLGIGLGGCADMSDSLRRSCQIRSVRVQATGGRAQGPRRARRGVAGPDGEGRDRRRRSRGGRARLSQRLRLGPRAGQICRGSLATQQVPCRCTIGGRAGGHIRAISQCQGCEAAVAVGQRGLLAIKITRHVRRGPVPQRSARDRHGRRARDAVAAPAGPPNPFFTLSPPFPVKGILDSISDFPNFRLTAK